MMAAISIVVEVGMNDRMSRRIAAVAVFCITPLSAQTATPVAAQSSASGASAGRQSTAGSGNSGAEPCTRSPICGWNKGRSSVVHELHTPDLGYTIAYPFALPNGLTGGVSAVAINSKDHLFAFQRNPAGTPQLFEFDQSHKLVRTIGEDVIGHQNKPHGMAIDAEDNIWICDQNGDTVMKLSPEGKLLMTIGVRGERGDWDE